jgi:hypothetical protein
VTGVLTKAERSRERIWILDGAWPHHPIAPVIRGDLLAGDAGLIVWHFVAPPTQDRPVRVYLANLAECSLKAAAIQNETGQPVSWGTILEGVERIDYPTLDASSTTAGGWTDVGYEVVSFSIYGPVYPPGR